MNSAAAPSAATPRQVTCETSDQQHIAVELDVLRLSPTFDDMYKNLGLEEEGGEFPGTFPVPCEARVFKKVVDWCKAHKDQPDPVVEKDPFTQESKRFELTDDDRTFFDVPSPELLKLVLAANYLDIRGLYQYGCQAIADLVKGKETLEARHILQQHFDLLRSEIRCTRSQCPWLNPKVDVVGMPVANPILIPTEVLTTIFGKLTRADLERLQLVSQQFRNIILHNKELPQRLVYEFHSATYALVDALKKAFLSATSRRPYVLRIHTSHWVNEVLWNALGEQLRIRFEVDYTGWPRSGVVVAERK